MYIDKNNYDLPYTRDLRLALDCLHLKSIPQTQNEFQLRISCYCTSDWLLCMMYLVMSSFVYIRDAFLLFCQLYCGANHLLLPKQYSKETGSCLAKISFFEVLFPLSFFYEHVARYNQLGSYYM